MNWRCFLTTSLGWVAFIAIGYAYAITSQRIIIPNQIGYMEVRHNDLVSTPSNFEVTRRQEQSLDQLVRDVVK